MCHQTTSSDPFSFSVIPFPTYTISEADDFKNINVKIWTYSENDSKMIEYIDKHFVGKFVGCAKVKTCLHVGKGLRQWMWQHCLRQTNAHEYAQFPTAWLLFVFICWSQILYSFLITMHKLVDDLRVFVRILLTN